MNLEQVSNLEELLAQQGKEVTTAFLVYQTQDGQWTATAKIAEDELTLDREATFDDIIAGASAVYAGSIAQQTAMHTILAMETRAAMAQKMMREQAESQKISQLIDPSKLRNPNA